MAAPLSTYCVEWVAAAAPEGLCSPGRMNKAVFDTERAIQLAAEGKTYREIGRQLHIDRNTAARFLAGQREEIARRQIADADFDIGDGAELDGIDLATMRDRITKRMALAAMGYWNPTQLQYEIGCRFLGWSGGSSSARPGGQDVGGAAAELHVHLGDWRPPAARALEPGPPVVVLDADGGADRPAEPGRAGPLAGVDGAEGYELGPDSGGGAGGA